MLFLGITVPEIESQMAGTARAAGPVSYTHLLRVYAEPFADNAASCRVLEKAGFRLEGVMRHSAVKNGVVRDMRLYSLLREDLECIGS